MKNTKRKIHVIGINSFTFEELSLNIQDLLINIKNIAAPESFNGEIRRWVSQKFIDKKNFFDSKSNLELINWIKSIDNDVILISRGDPLWFGIGRILLEHFSRQELLFYPSQTCLQLAFSKLKKPWQEAKAVSIHGRDSSELIKLLNKKEKSIVILTDPKNNSLELIRRNLKELELENYYEFWLLEELGYEQEKITLILNDDKLPKDISNLNLVILFKQEPVYQKYSLPLFGINDNYFQTYNDRPNLLTKRDIRIQLLADLELPEFGTLFDIGSGSGTIGLEALRIRPNLNLICIDKRFGSQSLIQENAKRLSVSPIKIIERDVKDYLINADNKSFSNSNRIIIGGCGLETKILVIEKLNKFLKRNDIIVLPVITYEVLQQIDLTLKEFNYEINMRLIQTFKGISIADGTRFEPNNPVFIIKAKKK